ncbi:MAG: DUF882 domain-containing protein [Desulfobacterales bacterium]
MKGGHSAAGTVGDGSQNKPGGWIPIDVIDPCQAVDKRRTLPSLLLALLLLGLISSGAPVRAAALDDSRFFFSGDGRVDLLSEKNGHSFAGPYRHGAQRYDETALQTICRVFDAPYDPELSNLSLRLLEFLDFLQDNLNRGAKITITSGYRSPEYNTRVRNRGGLAAKASLHQYGMAADIKIEGVPARRVWDTVKALGFGGAGYYHGDTVHIDVGPARSWDETTSGVGTGISDDNKLIGLVSDYDRYRPGEMVTLRFIRMTAFPIGVASEFALDRRTGPDGVKKTVKFTPALKIAAGPTCPEFEDIDQMAYIRWRLPDDLAPGRYAVRVRFCGIEWKGMPSEIATPEFVIVRP